METKKDSKNNRAFRNFISNSMSCTSGLGIGLSLVGIVSLQVFGMESGRYLIYAGVTFLGLFLLSIYLSFVFHTIKKMDKDYFKNIMVGVSGGLAVWVFSGTKWDMSKGFWLAINGIVTRILIFLGIIFIGFVIYRWLEKES